ncbi:unnamed protein product [Paramecium octaurelia]|uniref:Uncharacterized protein n=1 Tax=Paramecium octaurelia TaxID=43137 RepID=A0A8S1RWD7_PAROT|nr:unnamed protein product [Paramecium octaurelia]
MKKFTIILIIVCLQLCSCDQCSDYFQDETGCIQSTGISCRWIEQNNQCQESTGTLIGCQNYLNQAACISQKVYPDKSIAECIFSGYCRSVIDDASECQKNLSRAGCLGVEEAYCIWKDQCIAISQSQAVVLGQATSATDELKLSSITVCQQIINFPAIHQHGAHDALTQLYFENLTSSGGENEYEQQMLIPGCFQPVTDIYKQIKCDAAGLNSLSCMLVETEPCIFSEGSCKKVFNFNTLSCSDKLNKIACLSITNFDQTCYWTGTQCTTYLVTKTTSCSISIQVSPSVCANVIKKDESCFYDSATMKCDQMCKSPSLSSSIKCELSKHECSWFDYGVGYCIFKKNQCDRQGQNYTSCMAADEYCLFEGGLCKSISNLNLLGCNSGLNKKACINLKNPSQVCQFWEDECSEIYTTPEDLPYQLWDVNQNACKKITTTASYWSNGSCFYASGNEECTTQGYNKLGCLNTVNTVSPCQWNGDSGSCQAITITRETKCESLKLVNAVACRAVQEEDSSGNPVLCKYNLNSTACEKVTVLSSINCETEGLNEAACSSVPDPLQSCRWSSNQCVKVTALGSAVTCQALQSVTQRTCAMVQSNNQRCLYDSSRKSCTTQVPPSTACTAAGLNPYGCAFVSSKCHFDTTTNQCKSTLDSDYATITCDTNFPSKSTCVLITKANQYCRWLGKDNVCELFSFPASDSCTKYSNVNKLFCLALEVSLQRYISSSYYCSYDTGTSSCTEYTNLASWADCGSTLDINLHACVALSNTNKYCYFDQTTLKCTEITDPNDSKFSSLLCKQANKKLCLSLSTTGQYCQWVDSEKKCQPIKSGQQCSDYVSMTVNPTLCASTYPDEACVSNFADSHCKVVTAGDTSYGCLEKGLNKKACLENTNGACYYDSDKLLCLEVSGTAAYQVSCFGDVNKLGCLASLLYPCKWADNACSYVYDIDPFNSICTDLSTQLYNPKVCQIIQTDGQYCQYDSVTFHCADFSDFVQDCKPGYNYLTCSMNNLCQWDSSSESCQPSGSGVDLCKSQSTETDCLSITNDTCSWTTAGKCKKIVITEYTQCSQVGSAQGKFVKRICQSIAFIQGSCQYDSTSKACVTVTTTNNQCNAVGLNKKACFNNTIGYKCRFESDTTKDDYGCQEVSDFSNQGCSDSLDSEACASVTTSQCAYNMTYDLCEDYSQYYLAYYYTCAQFSTGYKVTINLCKYLKDVACIYDSTTQTCKVTNVLLDQCNTNATINSVYCLTQIKNQTCDFDPYYGSFCYETDTSYWPCSYCQSFKQCVNSRYQICKWQDDMCQEITIDVQCSDLTSINSNACMSFSGNTKCQFKYDPVASTSSCIVPLDDTQPCSGLNEVACVANTTQSCFFYQKQCYFIFDNPYLASCTDDFSFNYKGCVRIMNSEQKCKWDTSLNKCVSTTTSSTDACTTYADSNYSATICASIESGNCIWNNGCKVDVALGCDTLGANKGACINALSGSCVYSEGVCIDVTTPSALVKNKCTDPSNQSGCLNMNQGQTCKWTGSTCQEISVTGGCTSYTNVNPGVCQSVTDVACKWTSSNCAVVIMKGLCNQPGLNKSACLKLTSEVCYFRSKNNSCTQITQQVLNELECTDNLNELACLSHQKKCCSWHIDTGTCQNSTAGTSCDSLMLNSPYCCLILTEQPCKMGPYCQLLTSQFSQCSDAYNKYACEWINSPCRWDDTLMNCIQVNKNYGCKPDLNLAGCVNQSTHCKYLNKTCMTASTSDTCKDLYDSSLSSTKCVLITNSRCLVSNNGCTVPPYNVKCTENLNRLACLDNVNYCVWNDTAKTCNGKRVLTASTTCATGIVSRGLCAFSKVQCKSGEDYSCSAFTNIDDANVSCDQRNAVLSTNSSQCLALDNVICQYDPTTQRCTSQIFGSVCTSIVTKKGCIFIENNCYWSNNLCLQYSTDKYFNTCEQIYTKYQCLVNINTSCYWDSEQQLCRTYKGSVVTCDEHTEEVISPGICFYFSSDYCGHDGTKCIQDTTQSVCANSKSPLGCQANTAGNCLWKIDIGKCIALADSSLAQTMTCVELKYSTKALCLAPIIEGQTCHWKDNLCQSANIEVVSCNDDLSLDGCRAVAMWGWFCVFKDKCQVADIDNIKCTDSINIHACLQVTLDGQYCKWLGQRCYSLESEDGFELSSHILINANVCRKAYTTSGAPDDTLKKIGVSYDTENYVCQLSNPEVDLCSTPGMNYYACLSTQADACDWTGTKCNIFDFGVTYTQCNQYISVSPKVCASIDTSNLKCQHNSTTQNCENFTETTEIFVKNQDGLYINTKKGMNRLACISVAKQPTIWANGRCEYNNVKVALITCNELVDVNPMSCAQIDKDNVTCKYFKEGTCTAQFDPQVDKCSTPGLNKVGCVSIETEQCRFSEGTCSKYEISNIIKCHEMTNVNALVCKNIINQNCKFSFVKRGCVQSYSNDKCSYSGLNQSGCNKTTQCQWIDDRCFCKGEVSSLQLIDCTKFTSESCQNYKSCIFDKTTGLCRNRKCSDLALASCSGTIAKSTCYVNLYKCSSASKCSELFNVDCSLYTIAGKKCAEDLWNDNHCIDQGCQHFNEDQCNGNCQWSYAQCVLKDCNYMKKESCTGIMNNKQCYWDGTYCQALNSCKEYITYSKLTDTTQQQQLCTSSTFLNKKCRWELIEPFGTEYQCTSKLCSDQGTSSSTCHGFEAQGEVCVLLPDFTCVACSEITDSCTCLNMNGYCYYSETKGCISNLCSDLDEASCASNSQRCTFINKQCKPSCGKLRSVECTARQQSSECHWNSNVMRCLDGAPPSVNLNTMEEVIVIESSISKINQVIIMLIMIYIN